MLDSLEREILGSWEREMLESWEHEMLCSLERASPCVSLLFPLMEPSEDTVYVPGNGRASDIRHSPAGNAARIHRFRAQKRSRQTPRGG